MTEVLVRDLAQQIVSDGLLGNWMFWAILLAVLFVGTVASAFVTTYIRKRGETYATKADLAELVAQLRVTTQAAEEVKTAIAHADWSNKEWKVLRRVKLEELLDAVHATQHWLELVCDQKLYDKQTDPGPSPLPRALRLTGLYFPELAKETSAFDDACRQYRMWILELQARFLDVGKDMAKRRELHTAAQPDMSKVYGATLKAVSAIEQRAAALMKEIIGV